MKSSQPSMNSVLASINFGRAQNDTYSGGESFVSILSGSLGLLHSDTLHGSFLEFEKTFIGTSMAQVLGLYNIEKAALFSFLGFIQSMNAAFSLGNLSPMILAKIPTGLFYKQDQQSR